MQQNDAQHQKMTETTIAKLVLTLAVPTIISMLVTSIYNVADAYFVSKLGTSATGAIGIVFSLMAVIQAIGFTVGMGAGSTISRLLGKKEEEQAQKIASSAFCASVVLGVLLSVPGLLFLEKLMLLLGATETMLPYAMDYARYILYVAPVTSAGFVLNNLLRAEGKTKPAMVGMVAGGVLNIALDPLFIFSFEMGVEGSAIATAISQVISFLILLYFYIRRKTIIRFSIGKIAREFSVYKAFLKDGMPSLFRQGLASVATVALNHVAAGQGDAAVAAMSIVGKIFMVVYCILIGFGQGYQPVAGYNYGAKEYARVKSAFRFTVWVGTAGMTLLGIGLYAMTPWLIRQFVPEDASVTEIGVAALRMQSAVLPFTALGVACNMTFQAVGKPVIGTFLAACRQGVFFLPFIWLFPGFLGILGMEMAQPAADVATFFACLPFTVHFLGRLYNKNEKKRENL